MVDDSGVGGLNRRQIAHRERFRRSFEQRFWARVEKGSDCWPFRGHDAGLGYRAVKLSDKKIYAHRAAWMLTHGPIPDGLFVCHACDNPPCVRPDHLFLGTTADNNRDRMRKGRNREPAVGEAHPMVKLSEAQVREIRARYQKGIGKRLAAEYGITNANLHRIVKRRTWKHI
jgi:hypothetical protein